jgi:hypothetical protein
VVSINNKQHFSTIFSMMLAGIGRQFLGTTKKHKQQNMRQKLQTKSEKTANL